MRKGLLLGTCFGLLVLISLWLHVPDRAAPGDSPAFQVMLSEAISGLESVTQKAATAGVPATQAAPQAPTVDEYTCMGFRTCNAFQTCDGTPTCDGEITCWASTCLGSETCQTTCVLYTRDTSPTCEGGPTCEEGCAGWPTYFAGIQTCDPGPTCEFTCPGFISCSGCAAVERTTWGAIKAGFKD
jgi:hypothetical protein